MKKPKPISLVEFLTIYKSRYIDLLKAGFFDTKDIMEFDKEGKVTNPVKLTRYLHLIPFTLKNISFVNSFILPKLLGLIPLLKKNKYDLSLRFVEDYNILCSILGAFKPKSLFEIGTYLGWGSASVKYTFPDCRVTTINPLLNEDANNPVEKINIGKIFKIKNLKVRQIYGDSTVYDFSKLGDIDCIFIDGNHKYEYVKSDLNKSLLKAKKAVIVDDYLPKRYSRNDWGLVYGPWTDDVVRAVNNFCINNSKINKAYWIKGSKLAVLVK